MDEFVVDLLVSSCCGRDRSRNLHPLLLPNQFDELMVSATTVSYMYRYRTVRWRGTTSVGLSCRDWAGNVGSAVASSTSSPTEAGARARLGQSVHVLISLKATH